VKVSESRGWTAERYEKWSNYLKYAIMFLYSYYDKSSAVAGMGDRLATIDRGQKVWGQGGCCAPFGRELGSHLMLMTQCHLGRALPLYQVLSWSTQPFGQYINVTDRHIGQTGKRSRSIGRTVTCNGRPKTTSLTCHKLKTIRNVRHKPHDPVTTTFAAKLRLQIELVSLVDAMWRGFKRSD